MCHEFEREHGGVWYSLERRRERRNVIVISKNLKELFNSFHHCCCSSLLNKSAAVFCLCQKNNAVFKNFRGQN